MKIVIVGTGYVGLVTGTGFAETGHQVTCVDINPERVDNLNKGIMPIYEPGLEELVIRNMEEERLSFTTDLAEAVSDCLLVFICVGTPQGADGFADLSQVRAAAEQIGKAMTGYRIIVNKSTCPVGTADMVREAVGKLTTHPFDVVSNPEFLKEGAAIDDFMRPDRVVVGCDDVRVFEIMKELYAPFLRTGNPMLQMTIRSAEMAKYATNTMLAARISMINELANIAEAMGADINDVREAVMTDSRIGPSYLFPGLGYGGSCLPKDVQAIAELGRKHRVPVRMLDAINAVNRDQRARFLQRIIAFFGDAIAEKRIAVWGATFKPRTDDMREAPAIDIIDGLLEQGATVAVSDPVAGPFLTERYGDRITFAARCYDALKDADALVICTEWREYHRPDFAKMGELMRERVIFDGRNLYTPKVVADQGFRYFCIGRPSA